MKYKHNEDTRVKIPLIAHITKLGYSYLKKSEHVIDSRNNIFKGVFKKSLEKINRRLITDNEIEDLIRELYYLSVQDDLGRGLYERITDQTSTKIKIIDFYNYKNNTYNVVSELKFINNQEFRPDITILINGLPLIIFEVKSPNKIGVIDKEFKRNEERLDNVNYKHFFNFIQLILISNNMEYEHVLDNMSGSYYTTPNSKNTKFNKFREEEDIYINPEIENLELILEDNNSKGLDLTSEFNTNIDHERPSNKFATSILSKDRLMFILRYGLMYLKFDKKTDTGVIKVIQKHIIRYQQLFSIFKCEEMLNKGIKKGVFWETQGSGKTALSLYLANYITDYFALKRTIVKFYFIVDRLELLNQTIAEFSMRGVTANVVNSKAEFQEDMNLSKNKITGQKIDITVVNIHKFNDFEIEENSYAPSIQRFYIIDEAHRSYNPEGSFLRNLISSDKSAIHIALTGTPLITNKYNSTDIFGDYIYKYYYDKSINDGYTLKIIKEKVVSAYIESLNETKKSVLKEIKTERDKVDKNIVYENKKYCASLGEYISKDFLNFRDIQEDNTLGGLVVCNTKEQCKILSRWFKDNVPHMTVDYVVDDVEPYKRKIIQNNYKKGEVDILFVYNMLLTGFDAPRLKRLYLLRVIRKHNLLQALTRVNRPYKSLQYGYIVDFAEIDEEYSKTNEEYLKELIKETFDIDKKLNLDDIFVGVDALKDLLSKTKESLKDYSLDNLEKFDEEIMLKEKKELFKIRKSVIALEYIYKDLLIVDKPYAETNIDILKIKAIIKLLNKTITQKMIREGISRKDRFILDDILNEFEFEFEKSDIIELGLLKKQETFKRKLMDVVRELNDVMDKGDKDFETLYNRLLQILDGITNKEGSFTEEDYKYHYELISLLLEGIKESQLKDKQIFDYYNSSVNTNIIANFENINNVVSIENCVRLHKRLLQNEVFTSSEMEEIQVYIKEIREEVEQRLLNNSNISLVQLIRDVKSFVAKKIRGKVNKEQKRIFIEKFLEEFF